MEEQAKRDQAKIIELDELIKDDKQKEIKSWLMRIKRWKQ